MKFFILLLLLCVTSIAFPTPISTLNPADCSENPEPSPQTSTYIRPTENYSKKRYQQPYLKTSSSENSSEMPLSSTDDYERLVAFCEAGFVSGCRAAIGGRNEN